MANEPTKRSSKFAVALGVAHEVVIEGIGVVSLPGEFKRKFELQIDNVWYTHVGEDGKGRWIYRQH